MFGFLLLAPRANYNKLTCLSNAGTELHKTNISYNNDFVRGVRESLNMFVIAFCFCLVYHISIKGLSHWDIEQFQNSFSLLCSFRSQGRHISPYILTGWLTDDSAMEDHDNDNRCYFVFIQFDKEKCLIIIVL